MTADPLTLIHGDCVEVMRSMPEASVDAIVTDPPYGIGFMGREWDTFSPDRVRHRAETLRRKAARRSDLAEREAYPARAGDSQGAGTPIEYDVSLSGSQRFEAWTEAWAREALRVLRPGGHLLSFCGARMQHRMIAGIEDAGFEIRDCLMWLYGSGFPKSLDVSKAIDKAKGAEREVVRLRKDGVGNTDASIHKAEGFAASRDKVFTETAPATELAQKWQGWGTALKPAWEPVILARKPLVGTVAQNVEQHGTGALNIDGTRIAATDKAKFPVGDYGPRGLYGTDGDRTDDPSPAGRWPANVLLAHTPECVEVGTRRVRSTGAAPQVNNVGFGGVYTDGTPRTGVRRAQRVKMGDGDGMETVPSWDCSPECPVRMLDEQTGELVSGKVEPHHRNHGKDDDIRYGRFGGEIPIVGYGDRGGASRFFYTAKADKQDRGKGNTHPTVKPVDLMRYLCRLVTPPGGVVLDPFAGSGTTGQAALAEGFRCVLIEREAEYVEGIKTWRAGMQLGLGLSA